jgi:predicted PurR-regulated permease PerM
VPKVRLAERPLIVTVIFAFALWVLLQLFSVALGAVVIILLALILATAMMPIVAFLERLRLPPGGWRVPRLVAVLLIYIAGFLFFAFVAYIVGSTLGFELSALFQSLPQIQANLARLIDQLRASFGITILFPSTADIVGQITGLGGATLDAIRAFLLNLADILFRLGFVLILALFLVIEAERTLTFWVDLFPPDQRPSVRRETTLVGSQISRWVLGQLVIAAINGTLAAVIILILGLPYPILIGVLTAIFDFTPVVGPAIMAVPVFFLGLSQSLLLGIVAAGALLVLAEFEAHVLQPLIIGRAVRISPMLVIIAIPFGLALYGFIGALIAVPVTASLQVLVRDLFLPWLHERQGLRPSAQRNPPDSP